MLIKLGDVITAKKPHPCGSREWTVIRVGADYKIKCNGCDRVVLLSKPELDKIIKSVSSQGNK